MSVEFSVGDFVSAWESQCHWGSGVQRAEFSGILRSVLISDPGLVSGFVSGELETIGFDAVRGDRVLVGRVRKFLGVPYAVVNGSFYGFFSLSPEGVVGSASECEAFGDSFCFADLGVSSVGIPFMKRGVGLSRVQAEVFRSGGVSLFAGFVKQWYRLRGKFLFDGVLFDCSELMDGVNFDAVYPLAEVDLVSGAAGENDLFLAEWLPLDAVNFALSTYAGGAVEPKFKQLSFKRGVKVPAPVSSSVAARRKYTELYLELADVEFTDPMFYRVVSIVSNCVESVEASGVWADEEMSVVAPRLDSYAESADIFGSLRSIHDLYVELYGLKSSLPEAEFESRVSVLAKGFGSLLVRVVSFVDYAAELDRLDVLVRERAAVKTRAEFELKGLASAADWDAKAAAILGDAVANEAAAVVNQGLKQTLEDLSADISKRIEYLELVRSRSEALAA